VKKTAYALIFHARIRMCDFCSQATTSNYSILLCRWHCSA